MQAFRVDTKHTISIHDIAFVMSLMNIPPLIYIYLTYKIKESKGMQSNSKTISKEARPSMDI